MKLLIQLLILSILVSCGGGSTGDITVNGGINVLNDSNNNNINNDNSQEASPSELALSILYNPTDAAIREKSFIRAKKNLPGLGFDSGKIQFTSDIALSEQTKAQQALSAAASVFGYLDIYYYGLGSNAVPYESLKASACAVFSYSNCNGNNMTFLNDVVSNGTSASGSFLIGLDTEAQPAHLIYQGATPSIDQIKTIHEYVRVYQNAVSLGMPGVPAWFKEGIAQYIAQWLGRERAFVAGTFSSHMDTMWDQANNNISFYSLEDQIVYKDLNNPLGFDQEKYGQALWAVGYMIDLANQRPGIINGSQAILSDLITQIRSKTWTVAFTDNVGMSPTAFYSSFASLLSANDKSSRLASLVTSNISSTVVPQYNYSNLQLRGASANSNNGGNPTTSKRSAYFFNSDTGEVPSYQGTQWPYIKAESSSTVSKEEGISAEIEIKNTNYVTINSSGSEARPIYQYVSDSESSVLGGLISGWLSINLDGNPIAPRSLQNTAPIINNATTESVNENQTSATAISVTDNDFNESLFFSLGGTDSSFFNLSNSGVITFKSAPNYELKNQYSLTLSVNDGEAIVSQGLIINILDTNDPPIVTGLANAIAYLEGSGANVLTVSASDEDAGASLSYSLGGSDATDFTISNAGVLTFNSPPVFETKNLYSISISVTDGIESVSQALTVNIQNTNSPPIISGLGTSLAFNENATSDVVTVNATDPDSGATVSYSLGGADAGALAISSSGVITFNSPPDYETKNSYSITVEASDGIESSSQAITINIQDQNDAPVISGLVSPISFDENATSNLVTINASDEDTGDSLSYSLGGADGANLSISNSGVITFNSPPDYEAKNQYSIDVIVSDGNLSASQSITVNIQNINEAPFFNGLASSLSYDENATTNLIDLSEFTTDPDTCTVLTFSLSGADANDFEISNSTACDATDNGVVTFKQVPDYETKNIYSISVTASDGNYSVSQAITINIQDLNELPLEINSASSFTANENQNLIGTVTSQNNKSYPVSYSLGGIDSASFALGTNSGVLSFLTAPDYETKNVYSITVTASTAIETANQNITINVGNVNEQPTRVGPSTEYYYLNINESLTGGQVATMQGSDPDANTTFIWSIEDIGNNHAQYFSINSSTGVISFNGVSFGAFTGLAIRVRVSDGMLSATDEIVFELFSNFGKQLGSNIVGEAAGDTSGYGMDINSSGNIVAIGAPRNDGAGTDFGHVRVFQYNPESGWSQLGADIDGGAQWGEDISLSDSGNIMLVSSTKLISGGTGSLQVYEYDNLNNSWSTRGSAITSNINDNDIIGDISGDGNTISFGTQGQNLKIHRWNGSDYVFEADVFDHLNSEEGKFPNIHSVSLSDNGNTVAISRTTDTPTTPFPPGTVNDSTEIFRYDGSSWSQIETLDCGGTYPITHNEVSLSSDGNKIIIGNYQDESGGYVCVYTYNGTSWNLKGDRIENSLGFSVDISDDGNTIAASGNGPGVKAYEWYNSSWVDLVQHNQIDEDTHQFGNSGLSRKVRISDDGEILAIGNPYGDFSATSSTPVSEGTDSGHVRVFD
tara:strand:+ start:189 stop:4841 length:4653 start_codon:yes stop_codon:yes gene_type:complete